MIVLSPDTCSKESMLPSTISSQEKQEFLKCTLTFWPCNSIPHAKYTEFYNII